VRKQGSPIVTFDTEIDILDREPRLRQGMSCDIDIIFSRRDSVLYLPVETVEELFDDEDGEEEVKGRRGRFVVYAVRPAVADSSAAGDTGTGSADPAATADTLNIGNGKAPEKEPDEAILDDFVEVELRVGLETNTRIEILSGLGDEDRVAADPELIRGKLERRDPDDESDDESGDESSDEDEE
jgi:hypothetical protein